MHWRSKGRVAARYAGRNRPCRSPSQNSCPTARSAARKADSVKQSRIIASTAARDGSFCEPTTAKDFGRQHAVAAAEHERIAEICHAFDESRSGRHWRDTGFHQRQETLAGKSTPAVGAQRLRRLFHRWAHAFDDADEHQKGDRVEGEPGRSRSVQPHKAGGQARRRAM